MTLRRSSARRLGRPVLGSVLGLAACSGPAYAQIDLAATQMVKALRDGGQIHGDVPNQFAVPTGKSLDPKFPVDSSKLGQTSDIEVLHADSQHMLGRNVVLDGNIEVLARGYRLTCDHAEGNLDTQIFAARGHVYIDGEALAVRGEEVWIDFLNRTYRAYDTQSQLGPKLVKGQLKDNLYVKGHRIGGTEQETVALNGDLTTCNKPMPHYDIEADSIVVRPGKRAIFRKTRIKILGYTVLRIPYLSVPLDDRSYRNTPEVGQSPDEGYYVKFHYGIPLKNPNYNLDTREDFMSKLGIGLGGAYRYQSAQSAGNLSAYHIFGKSDMLSLTNSHRQLFSWGSLSIDNDYERDNYLVAPGSTSLNTKIGLIVPQGQRGSDRLSMSRNSSSAFGYLSTSTAIGINDQRDYGDKFRTTLDVNYFDTSSSFKTGTGTTTTDTQRLDVHIKAEKDLEEALALMEYQRTIPIGSTKTFIGGQDETPVLSLESDGRRLLGSNLGQTFPFKTVLSWGDFQDPRGDSHISRGFFDFNFNRFDTSRSKFRVDMNGDFRQGIYSDGTAQYILGFGTNVRYDLGQNTGINLRYSYLRPYGSTPLTMDQTGQTNFVSSDLNFRPIKSLLLGAQTGYDLLRAQQHEIAWQQLGLRSEFQPEKWFLLRGLYTYDTFQQAWTNLRFDLTYTPGATRLSVGSNYDGIQHVWTGVNVFLQNLVIGKLSVSSALAYNGFLKSFDSEQFSFVYDLHCAEAVMELSESNTGFRPGRTIAFYIRLKALPYDVPLGVGTRGQPFGFNNGSSF